MQNKPQAKPSQTQPHPPSPDRSQPTILELSRECRRLFEAAKIAGGPAWDRFFDADLLLQKAFDDGRETPELAQVTGE